MSTKKSICKREITKDDPFVLWTDKEGKRYERLTYKNLQYTHIYYLVRPCNNVHHSIEYRYEVYQVPERVAFDLINGTHMYLKHFKNATLLRRY